MSDQTWRCYHCGETFDEIGAREHFGATAYNTTQCAEARKLLSAEQEKVIDLQYRLGQSEKDRDMAEQVLHALQEKFGAQSHELVTAMDRLGELSKFTIHKAGCRSLQWNKCSCGLQELVVEKAVTIRPFVDNPNPGPPLTITAHVHDFKPNALVPGEHVCSCGQYYVV